MATVADWIDQIVKAPEDESLQQRISGEVKELCDAHPAPGL